MTPFVLVGAMGCATGLVGLFSYLVFCGWIVTRTGSTAGLRDLAVAMRAFRGLPIGRRPEGRHRG